MEEPLIDFDFLNEISGSDPVYIYEVLQIFMNTTPTGLVELDQMIRNGEDWNMVSKQAHFLKSGVSVIKIRGMYDQLAEIEKLTRKHDNTEISDAEITEIKTIMKNIRTTFDEAHPLLINEIEKHKPAD